MPRGLVQSKESMRINWKCKYPFGFWIKLFLRASAVVLLFAFFRNWFGYNGFSEKYEGGISNVRFILSSIISKLVPGRDEMFYENTEELQGVVDEQMQLVSDMERKLVILNTYMRGGSTYLGAFFDENNDVFFWYEPVCNIYSAMMAAKTPLTPLRIYYTSGKDKRLRWLTKYEISYILHFLSRMLTCELREIPEEILSHEFLYEARMSKPYYRQCLQSPGGTLRLCQKPLICGVHVDENFNNSCHVFMAKALNNSIVNEIANDFLDRNYAHFRNTGLKKYLKCMTVTRQRVAKCSIGLSKICKSKRIIATKLVRGNYNFLANLLELHNSTYIIHYIRDPRGIIQSRKEAKLLSNKDIRTEAFQLCLRMSHDFSNKTELQKLYPDQIIDLKYEDLAEDPQGKAAWIYEKIGESEVPLRVRNWIEKASFGRHLRNEGSYDAYRKNSTATAYAWKHKLTAKEKFDIDIECQKFYELAGYSL